jgi:hypothetical protein
MNIYYIYYTLDRGTVKGIDNYSYSQQLGYKLSIRITILTSIYLDLLLQPS